ncbi:MAG: serine/threonine protein kinase [Kofleriaceae bacterium]
MVIHRDIKPANLVRRPDGTIALVDFGAAHVQGTTAGSTTIGTFGYMPIEQLAGVVDTTTDPYALGASLLHLLTRQEPWKLLHPRSLGELNVSPALRGFIDKLLAPEPSDRYHDAQAALTALDGLHAIELRRPRKPRRSWRPMLFAAIATVVVGGAGIFGLQAGSDEPVERDPASRLIRLHVESEPTGAYVSLDNRFMGLTPLTTRIPAREYGEVRIHLPGYLEILNRVGLDEDLTIRHRLTRGIGAIGGWHGFTGYEKCSDCHNSEGVPQTLVQPATVP